jgi:co-chaperonin GroES (HSP10)
MTPKALGDKIWVEKERPKETMEKGIIIPENAERTPRFGPSVLGTIVSAGDKCRELKAGMRIVLKDAAGDDYFYDGHTYTILRERDIVGIAS